jgi:hypothetical protein
MDRVVAIFTVSLVLLNIQEMWCGASVHEVAPCNSQSAQYISQTSNLAEYTLMAITNMSRHFGLVFLFTLSNLHDFSYSDPNAA